MDRWASLPPDLVIEILRRLEATAVVRCAAACKPWRRAIIGGAASLRPRPDRFVPGLLLGLFHWYNWTYAAGARLRRLPGYALSSARDGFILLTGTEAKGLCLSNPIAGYCAFLPAASLNPCEYILVTGGYDPSPSGGCGGGDGPVVRILAVEGRYMMRTEDDRITYQLFSGAGGGAWGPVKRSWELTKFLGVHAHRRSMVVCGDAFHWLAGPDGIGHHIITCTRGRPRRAHRPDMDDAAAGAVPVSL